MKKILALLSVTALISGCSSLDFDGNGRIDPVAYLQNADITVSWVDEEGNIYNVDALKLGEEVVYNYIQAKTGYRFEIVENGGIEITDPKGYRVRIARKQ